MMVALTPPSPQIRDGMAPLYKNLTLKTMAVTCSKFYITWL